jgi:hypothetical protein
MAFAPSSEGLFAMDQTLNDFAINRLEDGPILRTSSDRDLRRRRSASEQRAATPNGRSHDIRNPRTLRSKRRLRELTREYLERAALAEIEGIK